MKKHNLNNLMRGLCLVLCLCTLLPCVTVSAFATEESPAVSEKIGVSTTEPAPLIPQTAKETVWAFDFTTMTGWDEANYKYTTSIGSMTVTTTAEKSNLNLTENGLVTKQNTVDGQNQGSNGRAFFGSSTAVTSAEGETATDVSFIAGYDGGCLLLTAVLDFTMLPQNTDSLLPLITWTQNSTTGSQSPRFACVDDEGKLYDKTGKLVSETCWIKKGAEQTIQLVMDPDPEGKICEYALYVDGTFVFSDTVSILSGLTQSKIRFFHDSLKYDVALKKVSLQTIPTADWEGYQIKENDDGTFDLRLISLLHSLKYAEAGYEVIAAYQDANGNADKQVIKTTDTVYTSVMEGTKTVWSANEGEYILALAITDIQSNLERLELLVRPYTVSAEGSKMYGTAVYLTYNGLDAEKVFTQSAAPYAGERVTVSEDAHVRFGKYDDNTYGTEKNVEIKWDGSYNDYTRAAFFKFDLSELTQNAVSYHLSLTFLSGPATGTLKLSAVAPASWSEASLTASNVYDTATKSINLTAPTWYNGTAEVATFGYTAQPVVDITAYVKAALAYNQNAAEDQKVTQISFCLEFMDRQESQAVLYSREYNNGEKAPTIITNRSLFNYETNLDTYQNSGYEPWGYAELVVDDWYDNIWDIYARDYGYSIMNGTEDTDSKAYVAGDYSVELDVQSGSSFKTIAARTTETIVNYDALYEKPDYDEYGGLAADGGKYYDDPAYSAKVNGTKGYFGTYYDETNNRWWLITPEGNRYIALGICTVTTGSTTGQKTLAQTTYAGKDGSEWTSELLNKIGINTSTGSSISTAARAEGNYIVSTQSGVGLIGSYGSNIGVNASVGGSTVFSNNNTLNVFDPDFVSYAYDKAAKSIGTKSQDVYMLGWTSDNEIPANTDMLIRYLTLDPTVDETVVDDPATKDNEKDVEALNSRNAYSYAVAWTWLRKMTGLSNPTLEEAGNGSALIQMGGESKEVSYLELFRGFVYYRYYSIASDAVKTAAPNQLYLGCRELGGNYQCETVMRVAGIFCDVVTLNLYLGANPSATVIDNIHKWACKPAYVTEFYSKSAGVDDAGNQSGTQSYSIWEVSYPSLVSPTANTYYTVDSITTTVSGGTAKDTYYADGTALWSVEYTASDATAGTQSVEISAYIAKSDTTASVFYLADGETTYRGADGTVKTVPEIILTNNRGAGKVVRSQDDRGVYYETFALKMLESGFCVGWSWYRYQDNDMPLFEDANGNLVYFNDWDAYCDWEEGDGSGLTLIHKGENTDQSNLDANKGIVNNAMEEYTEFTSHITAIANNIYGLAEHFDGRRN